MSYLYNVVVAKLIIRFAPLKRVRQEEIPCERVTDIRPIATEKWFLNWYKCLFFFFLPSLHLEHCHVYVRDKRMRGGGRMNRQEKKIKTTYWKSNIESKNRVWNKKKKIETRFVQIINNKFNALHSNYYCTYADPARHEFHFMATNIK